MTQWPINEYLQTLQSTPYPLWSQRRQDIWIYLIIIRFWISYYCQLMRLDSSSVQVSIVSEFSPANWLTLSCWSWSWGSVPPSFPSPDFKSCYLSCFCKDQDVAVLTARSTKKRMGFTMDNFTRNILADSSYLRVRHSQVVSWGMVSVVRHLGGGWNFHQDCGSSIIPLGRIRKESSGGSLFCFT